MNAPAKKSLRISWDRIAQFWSGFALVLIVASGFIYQGQWREFPLYPEYWIYMILIPCGYVGFSLIHYSLISRSGGPELKPSFFAVNLAMPPLAVLTVCWLTLTISPNAFVLSLLVMPLTMPRARGYPRPCSPIALAGFYLLLSLVHAIWDSAILGPFVLEGIDHLRDVGSSQFSPIGFIPTGAITFFLLFRFIPWHRRSGRFLWPSYLPNLPKNKRGLTLIELLIATAILAIMAAAIAQSTMATHRALQRQEDWVAAIALAEDEIALLCARPALPEVGAHTVEPELAGRTYAAESEIEIKAGPEDSLREVRVTIRISGDANARDVTLSAILPSHPGSATE